MIKKQNHEPVAGTPRQRIIAYLKENPTIIRFIWWLSRVFLRIWGWFVPIQKKTMLFCSFGGRKFDDSPKAIYDEVCKRKEFDEWRLIWAFVIPEQFIIPRGEKIKVDTFSFFRALLYSRVWVSNSGMDRGIELRRKCNIRVETWHGTPLKKIGGEENQNSMRKRPEELHGKLDKDTIRCAQSEFDQEIFARVFRAEKSSVLLIDLPRNDSLLKYKDDDIRRIKACLNIPSGKKIILYMPTYREYQIDSNHETTLSSPITLKKWENMLGGEYVLLVRAHYAVTKSLKIDESYFVKDVSGYPYINDLYAISDILLSDYSSAYFDYAILDRPMLCYAYDRNEYEEKRGLYLNLDEVLPCKIDYDEDSMINHILTLNYQDAINKSRKFHLKFAPYAGNASKTVVDSILTRIK